MMTGSRNILFSPPMMGANLAGCKTQTRRLLTPNQVALDGYPVGRNKEIGKSNRWIYDALSWNDKSVFVDPGPSPAGNPGPYLHVPCRHRDAGGTVHRVYPLWWPGQLAWVKEMLRYDGGAKAWRYEADGALLWLATSDSIGHPSPNRWPRGIVVSIHMPRIASRLTIEVTEVRLQRLREIWEADAIAEGIKRVDAPHPFVPHVNPHFTAGNIYAASARDAYAALIDSLHGDGTWAANPWVIALTYKVHTMNIDALLAVRADLAKRSEYA